MGGVCGAKGETKVLLDLTPQPSGEGEQRENDTTEHAEHEMQFVSFNGRNLASTPAGPARPVNLCGAGNNRNPRVFFLTFEICLKVLLCGRRAEIINALGP